jgi:type IV pilus assembly protein PilO
MSTAVVTPRVARRVQALATELNLHLAGLCLLLLLNVYLVAHLALTWQAERTQGPEAIAQQRISARAADIAAAPLRGLDEKLAASTEQADGFTQRRLPVTYSQVAGELGVLANRTGVRLTRVQYAQSAVMAGSSWELTEVRMDASLSGDYRPLVEFVNALERDRQFFVINALGFTGAQGGAVNLRLRLTTYLREPLGSDQPGTQQTPGAVILEPQQVPGAAPPLGVRSRLPAAQPSAARPSVARPSGARP